VVIELLNLAPNELRSTLEQALKLIFPRSTYASYNSRELVMEYYFEKGPEPSMHTKSSSETKKRLLNGPKRAGHVTSLSLLSASHSGLNHDAVYYLESETLKATLNPKFNETFIFSDLVEGDVSLYKIDVQIWDWNRIADHKFLCHLSLPLSELLLNDKLSKISFSEEEELTEFNELNANWYALQCPPWGSEKKHWKARKPFKKDALRESKRSKWEEERLQRKKLEMERYIAEKEGTIEKLEKEKEKVRRLRNLSRSYDSTRRSSIPSLSFKPSDVPSVSYKQSDVSRPAISAATFIPPNSNTNTNLTPSSSTSNGSTKTTDTGLVIMS